MPVVVSFMNVLSHDLDRASCGLGAAALSAPRRGHPVVRPLRLRWRYLAILVSNTTELDQSLTFEYMAVLPMCQGIGLRPQCCRLPACSASSILSKQPDQESDHREPRNLCSFFTLSGFCSLSRHDGSRTVKYRLRYGYFLPEAWLVPRSQREKRLFAT
jgi:hypothetical protein